jgi:starch phosphorylase
MTIPRFSHRTLPSKLEGLNDLALDLRWSGSQITDQLWEILDAEAWELTENPYLILQNVSQARLDDAAQDTRLINEMKTALKVRQRDLDSAGWFGKKYKKSSLKSVAYFSMEFGLSEALPIYSGGLGILAGDHLKTANDLGVPVTGVGLLYQQGYFRQGLSPDGQQLEAFPYNDPSSLPVTPVQDPNGGWFRVGLDLPGRRLNLRVWKAQIGKVSLYLLDSNDPLNNPMDRAITDVLYASGQDRRFTQEIVLGMGGWQMLEQLGIPVDVCHLNEGHAALVILARARSFMEKNKVSFHEALCAIRPGNVFTTHTPIADGFDRFDPAVVHQHLRHFSEASGISLDEILDMGRAVRGNHSEWLNMAFLAVRGSGFVNGVSRLHGSVSQGIFSPLFPRWPYRDVPIGYVTNGVHVPTWDSEAASDIWKRVLKNKEDWLEMGETLSLTENVISDEELWGYRSLARKSLMAYVRRRLERQLKAQNVPADQIERAKSALDENALTLGFARRFASYKRPGLLLHDPDRLKRILLNSERPVQLIVAGKAHPNDPRGKDLIRAMVRFASQPDLLGRFVFLADYDIALTQELVAGVDVWINNPRRPWEACGTSGMKVLVNGGVNLSERDGWWEEAYDPKVGWALGDGNEHGDDPAWDDHEADQLYSILEREVIPQFYDREDNSVPKLWIHRVRESMNRLTPQFSSYRMMRQYVEDFYLPAAEAYHRRTSENGKRASALCEWQTRLKEHWSEIRLTDFSFKSHNGGWAFEIRVHLGAIRPDEVQVELIADPVGGHPAVRQTMQRVEPASRASDSSLYQTEVPEGRPPEDYTPRVIPFHPDAAIPLEAEYITWLR